MRRTDRLNLEFSRRINRRAVLLGSLQAAFVGTLAYRMRYLQVEQAGEFKLLAEENSIKIRLVPPARGLIFDRNGILIAGNEQNYRVTITREDAGDPPAVLKSLSELILLSDEDISALMAEMDKRSPTLPITVADRLSWEEFSRVAVNAPSLPGITTEVGLSRVYPRRGDFAHVLGYVGPVSDYDLSKLTDPDPLLQIPKFQIGKLGVRPYANGLKLKDQPPAEWEYVTRDLFADFGEFNASGLRLTCADGEAARERLLMAGLKLFAQIQNLFDRQYATAAQLGPTGFDANGNFVARPFATDANSRAPISRQYHNPIPSLNVALSPLSTVNLRAGYSYTLARPSFRELAPFIFFDMVRRRNIAGNPELLLTTIHHADLRAEWFPSNDEVFALSVFGKQFINPIERVVVEIGRAHV